MFFCFYYILRAIVDNSVEIITQATTTTISTTTQLTTINPPTTITIKTTTIIPSTTTRQFTTEPPTLSPILLVPTLPENSTEPIMIATTEYHVTDVKFTENNEDYSTFAPSNVSSQTSTHKENYVQKNKRDGN